MIEMRGRVAIIQMSMPHYRRRFFELLRDELSKNGIDLILIYAPPTPIAVRKRDTADLDWGHKLPATRFRLGQQEMYWLSCLRYLKGADLVVVEQASKLLHNYILFIQHLLGLRRLAFWGHGKNFQVQKASTVGESIKHFVSKRVHWWFAYNRASADAVTALGFPERRITSVQNAIDTRTLISTRASLTPMEIESIRAEVGISSINVALYIGAMYTEKRMAFLLDACMRLRKKVSDFEVIIVGAGPDEDIIRSATEKYSWIHYVGPKFEREKVPYFAISKVLLIPGAVGLAILDAFALETPLITTDDPSHGPEIEYLKDGNNGLLVSPADDVEAYADAVASVLLDPVLHGRLVSGCRQARQIYTVEAMVERFSQGIIIALDTPS